jgi:lipoprotein-anchoring transpeptidase ErfK/SrfK
MLSGWPVAGSRWPERRAPGMMRARSAVVVWREVDGCGRSGKACEDLMVTRTFAAAGVIAATAGLALGLSAGAAHAQYRGYDGRYYYGYRQYYSPQDQQGYAPIQRSVASVGGYGPNTIVISTSQRRLYYVGRDGQAVSYGIGVGRDGFRWSGVTRVSAKREWPGWTPPAQMRRRQPGLPGHMPGGINNPLGARALYLGSSLYRIHGSNEPHTIGQAVSSGCFRMTNEDVVDLYSRVAVGTRVVVLR